MGEYQAARSPYNMRYQTVLEGVAIYHRLLL